MRAARAQAFAAQISGISVAVPWASGTAMDSLWFNVWLQGELFHNAATQPG
jgi:hypothetical protein